MSIGWICNSNCYDGVHKVKHKLIGEESFVYVGETLIDDVDLYAVFDCKTDKVINCEDYEHLKYYEDGRYFECSDHKGEWLFDDGNDHYDECSKCKEVQEEILSYKVAEDIYQYKTNREFNRLKWLLSVEKYRSVDAEEEPTPQQGLMVIITEFDSESWDMYRYYKTIEKNFIYELEWSEK